MSTTAPFWSWKEFFCGNQSIGLAIVLNVILFIPLGYLLASIFESGYCPFLICFFVSISIESIQYLAFLGFFDIDDITNNSLGGLIGICIFRLTTKFVDARKLVALIIVAGVCGCALCPRSQQKYITQFDFSVDEVVDKEDALIVSGTCYVYRRESLSYEIIFDDGEHTYTASTNVQGRNYVAVLDENPKGSYEIKVRFQGYDPISTQTYLNGGMIQYVNNPPHPDVDDTDLEFIVNTGILKCYQEEYDVYIYQVGDMLYWIVGKPFDASIILHVYTDEIQKLPVNRKKYGFDNLSFVCNSKNSISSEMECGRYAVFRKQLPKTYHISAIMVGMNMNSKIYWKQYFRVDTELVGKDYE